MQKKVQIELFEADWMEGLLISQICQRHTLSRDQVVRLRVRLELPSRKGKRYGPRKRQELPTQEEIRRRAAEVRKRWSKETERKRRGIEEEQFYEIPQNVESPEGFDSRWYE